MNDIAMYTEVASLSQEKLVETYAPMVKRIAHHLLGRLPNNVQADDLIQSGMIGLLDAARNYDATKGASFQTYAGIRVRGSMLDEVRKNDWLPRSVYRNARKIAEAVRRIENRFGRDARNVEIAAELGTSLDDYHHMLKDTVCGQLYSYEDLGIHDDVMGEKSGKALSDPLEGVQRENFQRVLSEVISSLPEREQLVLALYYDEELNLKEIGMVLGVSESRVCQIHSQAMCRIQGRLPDLHGDSS